MKRLLVCLLLVSLLTISTVESRLFASEAINTPSPATTQKTTNLNQPIKAKNTHGEYQNNTNACVSCHQTHKGSAENLIGKDEIYNTCTSCHDGTLGFYNVFSASTAGTFGGTAEGNASAHMATGALQIKAAPGGIYGTYATDEEIRAAGGNWLGEFNCASCHSPHGSYSDRLLHYNPNNMGNTDVAYGGNKAVSVPVIGFNELKPYAAQTAGTSDKASRRFVLVKGTKLNHGILDTEINDTDLVIALYEWRTDEISNSYVRTEVPWLYGFSYVLPKRYWTVLYKTQTPDLTTMDQNGNLVNVIDFADKDVRFNFARGYAYGAADGQLGQAVTGDIAQAFVTKMDKVPIGKYGDTTIYAVSQAAFHMGPVDPKGTAKDDPEIVKVDPITRNIVPNGSLGLAVNAGSAISKFCAACHVDYLAHSGQKSGIFNNDAYRHTTTNDHINCVRCHFAHGTDLAIIQDAKGRTLKDLVAEGWPEGEAKTYLLDENKSSALKRFTNMASCYACHTGDALKQSLLDPYTQEGQFQNMPDMIPYSQQQHK